MGEPEDVQALGGLDAIRVGPRFKREAGMTMQVYTTETMVQKKERKETHRWRASNKKYRARGG